VQIFEIGEHDGKPFLALEFCAGGSLDQKLKATPQPPREAAQMLETLARAMHAAHQAGIMHRDLKPGNVLLTADGTPKIADFGLAKRLDQDAGQTRTGDILGTPPYMAPEQAEGRIKEIGPATDVYALGAILYEMLTGRPPFKGATAMDTLKQVVTDEPVPPSRLQPKVPRDLETICLKCLRKDLRKRYSSTHELAEDLRHFLASEPIAARPVGRLERGWRWCRRNPVVVGFTGLTALLLVVVAVTATIGYFSTSAALEQTQTHLYISQINLAQQALEANDDGRALDALEAYIPQPGQSDRRGWEWYHLRGRCRILRTLNMGYHIDPKDSRVKGMVGTVEALDWSPDGRWLAAADVFGSVQLLNMTQEHAPIVLGGLFEKPHFQNTLALAWSPDSRRLAFTAAGEPIKIWDVDATSPSLTLPGLAGVPLALTLPGLAGVPQYKLAWSPEGKRLAGFSDEEKGTVKVWDLGTGRETFAVQGKGFRADLAWSRDGTELMGSGDKDTEVLDASTGRTLRTLKGTLTAGRSPDGRQVAAPVGNLSIKVSDAATGKLSVILHGRAARVMTWSSDSRQLASGGTDPGKITIWATAPRSEAVTLQGDGQPLNSMAWAPDGRQLASASRFDPEGVRIWDSDTGQTLRTLPGPSWNSMAWSGDSTYLATVGTAGARDKIQLWNTQTWEEVSIQTGMAEEPQHVAWSADSSLLAAYASKQVKVWRRDTLAEVSDLTISPALAYPSGSLKWSRQGQRLFYTNIEGVQVWEPTTGKPSQRLTRLVENGDMVSGVTWAPDDRLLAGSRNNRIEMWDMGREKQVRTLRHHSAGPLQALAWSPDSRRLVSVGGGVMKIWDAASGLEMLMFRAPAGSPDSFDRVAWSPDGRRIAASLGNTAKIWDAPPREDPHARGKDR